MKELENMRELNEVEKEKVAGGQGDGLPTIFNPGPDVTAGQENGRPLPFPQNRRDLTDLPCDDPFYTKAVAPVEAPKKGRSL